jgi:hypothetical protein
VPGVPRRRREDLIEAINPTVVEHVWAEPYNDRVNWRAVREGYASGSPGYDWLTRVYQSGDRHEWSRYSTELYTRLATKARQEGWISKVRFLQYEHGIAEEHATRSVILKACSCSRQPTTKA